MELILAHEGIFPVTKDAAGALLNSLPATGLNCAGTIQGEGKLAGVPSLFVRLAHCNLHCMWQLPNGELCGCDTHHSTAAGKSSHITIDEAVKTVVNNTTTLRHVVITGGEPLLQSEALAVFAGRLKSETNLHLTLETNGTIFSNRVAQHIDLFSISPKLDSSAAFKSGHPQQRICPEVLQKYIDTACSTGRDIQLKFVVASLDDETCIKQHLLSRLNNWDVADITVMPLGTTASQLQQTSPVAFHIAVKNGWRYSPRLHITLFGNQAGV